MAVTHPVVTAEPNDPDYDVSATAWNQAHTVADGSFVAAKLAASATDKVFGRSTAGAGNGEEIPLTAFGRSLIDDAAASNARTTLGLVIGTDVPGQAAFDDHSARHETGGADAIKLDDLAAPDDNTDLNASTTKHGLMPKGTGSTTTFFRSDMTQATPAGGGATHSFLGYNTAGASFVNMNGGYAKKITLAADGLITSIDAYVKGNSTNPSRWGVLILDDNANAPGKIVAANAPLDASLNTAYGEEYTSTARWVSHPIGAWLPAGDYWIAVSGNGNNGGTQLAFDGSGTDRTTGTGTVGDAGVVTYTAGTNRYSLRASVLS